MRKDDFYTPTDVDVLRMENELLAFEVRFLKTQTAETGRLKEETERLKEETERLKEETGRLKSRLEESERLTAEHRSRLAESEHATERAEEDLTLLLRRLGSSPLGPFFRLKQNFRVLEQRYLDTEV